MTKFPFRPLLTTSLLAACGAVPVVLHAAPAVRPVSIPPADSTHLPLAQIKAIQRQRALQGQEPIPAIQPYWEGKPLKLPMRDLLSGPAPDLGGKVKTPQGYKKVNPKLYAQIFPRPVPPASPRNYRAPATQLPKWVRYPLEFQLAGISLGTRAVDKDRFNRIDRYGLFALHGNPTAVVRSLAQPQTAGAGEQGGAPGAGGRGGAPAGAGGQGAQGGQADQGGQTNTNLTLLQQPPEITSLFPPVGPQGGLPDWALAVTVQLDQNHVQWLYKRDTYAMGFVVDRLGFVDAVIVAGIESDIARTQLEDPVHTVKLGDDFRKVVFRYGYPDDIVPLAADPAASANSVTGAPGGGGGGGGGGAQGGAPAGAPGQGQGQGGQGGAGAQGGAATGGDNAAYRTYDLRYEQSYNVVFTIRNNRVVRIYIFGDPDFFNQQRRNTLRRAY